MTLLDNGWTEDQAKGLIDSLKLTGGVPDWKPSVLPLWHRFGGSPNRKGEGGCPKSPL